MAAFKFKVGATGRSSRLPVGKVYGQYRRSTLWLLAGTFFLSACSSAPTQKSTPRLSELEGKRIALVSVDGEDTARKVIEVALVNQLVKKGSFFLISKGAVESARTAPDQNPMDWKGIAKKAGADFALTVRVLDFSADTHEGYSTEEVYDSQLAEEQGTDGKTRRVFKVKSLEGHVQTELTFTPLGEGTIHSGIAEAKEHVEESAKTTGIHLPPKLRFLENLANRAFAKFFEQYQ